LSLGVSAIGVALLLASCAPTVASSGSVKTSLDPLGRFESPVSLTAVSILYPVEGEVPATTTPENQSFNSLADEFLNIRIRYLWSTTPDEYDQKFTLSASAGQIPDLIRLTNPSQFEFLADSGQLADLTEAYQYLLPEIKAMYEKEFPGVLDTVRRNGKLLALPTVANPYEAAQRLYIRKDWLKKLGKKVPTTYQEMVDLAVAFATQDPDGNGKADTVGLAINKHPLWAGSFGTAPWWEVFRAYPTMWVKGEDGKVHDTLISPQMRQAVLALHDLYAKGALDREFYTKDADALVPEIQAGKVGMVFGEWWTPEWPLGLTVKGVPGADWVPVVAPTFDGQPNRPGVKRYLISTYNSVAKTADPVAAVKLMNLFWNVFYADTAAQKKYGARGTQKGGFFHNFVPQVLWNALDSTKEYYRNNAAVLHRNPDGLPPRELENHYKRSVALLDQGNLDGWGIYHTMVSDDSGYAYVASLVKNPVAVYDEWYGAPSPKMTEKGENLGKKAEEAVLKTILSGDAAAWDRFVEEYQRTGGREIEDEVNQLVAKR